MKTILVTGANTGLGLEMCRQLHALGDRVIGACRTASPELAGLGVQVETGIDVASEETGRELIKRLGTTRVSWLVHNAGIYRQGGLDDLDASKLREEFAVNALGPLLITRALLPLLDSGSKIGLITSLMGSLGDNGSGGSYGYRMSKAALNMAGVSLARDLKGRGIAVALLHPGFVRTRMTGQQGYLDPPESVRGLLARLDELTLATSGHFWHANGKELPW